MIKNENSYKKLILRRDICRFILDLRIFSEMLEKNEMSRLTNAYQYQVYMFKFINFDSRLAELMNRAKELQANPNPLSEHEDELAIEVKDLLADCTPDERSMIANLELEISSILNLCPKAETLCRELMDFYDTHFHSMNPLSDTAIRNTIKTLIANYTGYKTGSSEYNFLMERYFPDLEFSRELVASYFFQDGIDKEDHMINFSSFIEDASNKVGSYFLKRLCFTIEEYVARDIPLYEEDLTYLIENWKNAQPEMEKILRALAGHPQMLPFTAEAYLDALFADITTNRDSMEHYAHEKSPFILESDDGYSAAQTIEILRSIIVPLSLLASSQNGDFMEYLGGLIARLPHREEVFPVISNYLRCLQPDNSSSFEKGYLQGFTTIPKQLTMMPKRETEQN